VDPACPGEDAVSDFLWSTRPRPPGSLAAALRPWLRPVTPELVERHGPWGSLVVAVPSHETHALYEEAGAGGGLSVVVGNPVVRLPGTEPGPIHRGDRRARIHAELLDPLGAAEALDGHFAGLRLWGAPPEAATGTRSGPGSGAVGVVVTDRFGFVTVFHAEATDGALLVGTHVDALAAAAGRAGSIDPVSAADLCANYTNTYPWTLYRDVFQAEPGACRWAGVDGWLDEGTPYWRPREGDGSTPLDALAGRLRTGFVEGVAAATAGADRAALLLSGGEDSRAVLGAVPDHVRARGIVFAEWESREVRVARAVARAYGADLVRATRSPDHYADGFEHTARLVGSGHLFIDIHGYGLDVSPPLRAEPVVLGGLSADSLLKAEYAPEQPGARFRSKRPTGLREELLEAADERRNQALDWLRQWRPRTALEWHVLWPFSMRKHGGNVDGNRRLYRNWEAFHATAVLDVGAVAPLDFKRRRRLYLRAMRPLFAGSAWVPHAEYRFPFLGAAGNALALPALALARGLRALATGELRVRHRPWPKWRALVASDAMADREQRLPIAGTDLQQLFQRPDPAAIHRSRDDWYALRRLMLAQLAYVLHVHDRGDR
jgi:hypothetical protein